MFLENYIQSQDFINELVKEYNLDLQRVRVDLLLNLPQFSKNDFLQDSLKIETFVKERLSFLHKTRGSRSTVKLKLEDLKFSKIDNKIGEDLHQRHHYLGSPRFNSDHFALIDPLGNVNTLITFSDFDLNSIEPFLPTGVAVENIRVLSRGFAFENSPPNNMSYLLKRVVSYYLNRSDLRIQLFLTYLNTNLGFSGSSYRASNWLRFGYEYDTNYKYLDGEYVTDRFLRKKAISLGFGSIDRLNYKISQIPLKPLEVYVYFLEKGERKKYKTDFNHLFAREKF